MTEAKETSIDPKDWTLLALLSVLWGEPWLLVPGMFTSVNVANGRSASITRGRFANSAK
jgi:hypothetical protein